MLVPGALIPKLRVVLAKRVANSADRTRINGWIWQLARNAVIDHYRRNPRWPRLEPAEPRPTVEAIVISWLAPMVDQLPEPYRKAVRLSEIEGLAQAEVAARLSISVSWAKWRTQRGRVKLRKPLIFEPRTSNACVFCERL